MQKDLFVLEFVEFRSARSQVVSQSTHESFLESNSMRLAYEVIRKQTLQSIYQRHVLRKSSDKGRELKPIVFRQMRSQGEQIRPEFQQRFVSLLSDVLNVFVVKLVSESARD